MHGLVASFVIELGQDEMPLSACLVLFVLLVALRYFKR